MSQPTTIQHQLQLQAAAYGRAHAHKYAQELLEEEQQSQPAQPPGGGRLAFLKPSSLKQSLPAAGSTLGTTTKVGTRIRPMQGGPDPAAQERVVLDWVAEMQERVPRMQRRRGRHLERQQAAAGLTRQPGQGWWQDGDAYSAQQRGEEAWMKATDEALLSLQELEQWRRPLPAHAPRAQLVVGKAAQGKGVSRISMSAPIPMAWLAQIGLEGAGGGRGGKGHSRGRSKGGVAVSSTLTSDGTGEVLGISGRPWDSRGSSSSSLGSELPASTPAGAASGQATLVAEARWRLPLVLHP